MQTAGPAIHAYREALDRIDPDLRYELSELIEALDGWYSGRHGNQGMQWWREDGAVCFSVAGEHRLRSDSGARLPAGPRPSPSPASARPSSTASFSAATSSRPAPTPTASPPPAPEPNNRPLTAPGSPAARGLDPPCQTCGAGWRHGTADLSPVGLLARDRRVAGDTRGLRFRTEGAHPECPTSARVGMVPPRTTRGCCAGCGPGTTGWPATRTRWRRRPPAPGPRRPAGRGPRLGARRPRGHPGSAGVDGLPVSGISPKVAVTVRATVTAPDLGEVSQIGPHMREQN